METEQDQINKIQQKGFDEKTKQKIQVCLDEIDRKEQKIPGKTKYIRFVFDRDRKLLQIDSSNCIHEPYDDIPWTCKDNNHQNSLFYP
jgi:hypothetical protein